MAYNLNSKGGGEQSFEDKSFTPEPVFIKSYYKDDGKTVLPELFDDTATKAAKSFTGKNKYGNSIGVTITQLRRIFDEVKRFEQILSISPEQWDAQYPYIRMIKSKVAYQIARKISKEPEVVGIYKNFEKFINSCINLIHSKDDYLIFAALFEATYGFYYDIAPKSAIKQ